MKDKAVYRTEESLTLNKLLPEANKTIDRRSLQFVLTPDLGVKSIWIPCRKIYEDTLTPRGGL
jgi:hypothetical protein